MDATETCLLSRNPHATNRATKRSHRTIAGCKQIDFYRDYDDSQNGKLAELRTAHLQGWEIAKTLPFARVLDSGV